MPATSMHRCPNCREWFTPDRYNAWHQRYCAKPLCRLASRRASSTRWRRKNRDYFRGEENCLRVRLWRADHPGYWRRRRRRPAPTAVWPLQDVAPVKGAAAEGVLSFFPWIRAAPDESIPSLESPAPSDPRGALQDLAFTQHVALTALVLHLRGEPLQDVIGAALERVYQCGRQRWGGPEARGPP